MKRILVASLSALFLFMLCACTTDSELAKIKEEQYNAGLAAGLAQGEAMYYENGRKAGYEEGHADAIQEGYDDGYDEGYSQGYESVYEYGYKLGYNNGSKNGYDDGYHDAFYNSIEYKWSDLKDFKNFEELCDCYNVDFEYMYNYFWDNEDEIKEVCYEYTGDEYDDWYEWAENIDLVDWFLDNVDLFF